MKTMHEANFRYHDKSCNNCKRMDVNDNGKVFESNCSIVGLTNLSVDLFRVITWNESRVCDEWKLISAK